MIFLILVRMAYFYDCAGLKLEKPRGRFETPLLRFVSCHIIVFQTDFISLGIMVQAMLLHNRRRLTLAIFMRPKFVF